MLGIRHYKGRAIDLFLGDITQFCSDIMVNATDTSLSGGGGVDRAIHEKAGPRLLDQCKAYSSLSVGSAILTDAFNLPCKKLIHTVGPVWDEQKEEECNRLLESAYLASFELAQKENLRHLSLSAISTGAFKFPMDQAAILSMKTLKKFVDESLNKDSNLSRFTWVLFEKDHYEAYQEALFSTFEDN